MRKSPPTRRLELASGGRVCGVDEVGYSPIAGPVVAAAVILHPGARPRSLTGLRDSKQHSRDQRERYFDRIRAVADVGIGEASTMEIDQLNIYQANKLAMARAVANLSQRPDVALVDGKFKPDLPCPVQNVIKGDEKCLCIAAASIMAKVTRDRFMVRLAARYPGYGWESNVGYGTETHYLGLLRLGATSLHRRSFAPLRTWLADGSVEGYRFEAIGDPRASVGNLFELRNGLIALFDEAQRHLGTLVFTRDGWRLRSMGYTNDGRLLSEPAGPLLQWHNAILSAPTLESLQKLTGQ